MKKLFLLTIFITLFIVIGRESEAKTTPPPHAEYGYFYSSLSPYGRWVELEPGFVVWRPTIMKRSWKPYSHGRWVWTNHGWYWDSYEPFGYIVFHYGRWYFDDYYGWIWIPDNVWGPSWVEWRYDNNYIGWAPLPPYAHFSINIGLRFTRTYYTPVHCWHFVNYRHFNDPYVVKYYVNDRKRRDIYSGSSQRTDYVYRDGRVINRGVDVDIVRKRGGSDIRVREIETVNSPQDLRADTRRRDGGRGDERIRTYIPPAEEFKREVPASVKIERSEATDRRTSLDLEKVELVRVGGEREDVKGDERDRSRNGLTDRGRDRSDTAPEVKREESRNDLTREERGRLPERREETIRAPEVKRESSASETPSKAPEVKRENPVRETPSRAPEIKREEPARVPEVRRDERRETPARETPSKAPEVRRENPVRETPSRAPEVRREEPARAPEVRREASREEGRSGEERNDERRRR
jgi:hypothetical protein